MSKISIRLPAVGEVFQVKDFSEKYEGFLRSNPAGRPQLNLMALLLILVGGLAAVNGVLSFFMGSRYIVLDFSSNPFSFHYIRIHFLVSLALGLSLLLIGLTLFKEGAGISAERFLAEEYELIGEEGALPETAYTLKYLGEGHFLVKRYLGMR